MYAPNQGEGWNGQQEETNDILIDNREYYIPYHTTREFIIS